MRSFKKQILELRESIRSGKSTGEKEIAKDPIRTQYELDAGIDRRELAAGHERHELPGSRNRL